MKPGQYFSLVLGSFFLLIGFMGFIPGLMERPEAASEMAPVFDGGFGYLLGVFRRISESGNRYSCLACINRHC